MWVEFINIGLVIIAILHDDLYLNLVKVVKKHSRTIKEGVSMGVLGVWSWCPWSLPKKVGTYESPLHTKGFKLGDYAEKLPFPSYSFFSLRTAKRVAICNCQC